MTLFTNVGTLRPETGFRAWQKAVRSHFPVSGSLFIVLLLGTVLLRPERQQIRRCLTLARFNPAPARGSAFTAAQWAKNSSNVAKWEVGPEIMIGWD